MYIKLQIDVPVLNQRLVAYSGKSRVKLPVYSFLSQVRLCFLLEQLEKQKKMTTPVPYLSVLAYQSRLQITVQRSRLLNVGFVCLFVFVLFSQFVLFFFFPFYCYITSMQNDTALLPKSKLKMNLEHQPTSEKARGMIS